MSELLKSMTTRVVGVSFDNDDGTSRQDIISGLSVGEALLLNYHEYEIYNLAEKTYNNGTRMS